MKHLKLLALFGALAVGVTAQVQYTNIRDTLSSGIQGQMLNGSIDITWQAFNYDGYMVAQGRKSAVPIANGVINFSLAANDHNGIYPAVYAVTIRSGGVTQTSFWQVPTMPSDRCASAMFCTVKEVTVYQPGPNVFLNFGPLADGQYCMDVVKNTILSITSMCGGGGAEVSWSVLTSQQWTELTSTQWASLTP